MDAMLFGLDGSYKLYSSKSIPLEANEFKTFYPSELNLTALFSNEQAGELLFFQGENENLGSRIVLRFLLSEINGERP